jgi:hypothetical protein
MTRCRSRFTHSLRRGGAVMTIVDRYTDAAPTMTVTNDAENVIQYLHEIGALPPAARVVYRDTDGRWDELRHDGCGTFVGFAPVGAYTVDEAVTAVLP